MIFYTIQGPGHELQIHDNKICLIKKTWLGRFSREDRVQSWELLSLSGFEISTPRFLFWGKIEWRSYDGTRGSFRFSTNPEMVKKIEKYMQKLILKNVQRKNHLTYVRPQELAA